jgi:hypothetical protein
MRLLTCWNSRLRLQRSLVRVSRAVCYALCALVTALEVAVLCSDIVYSPVSKVMQTIVFAFAVSCLAYRSSVKSIVNY